MIMTQNNKKHTYMKPSMKVYPLKNQAQLLAGSLPIDPDSSPNQW